MNTPLANSTPVFLGIDLGGTNIKVGLVDGVGETCAFYKRKTEADRGPDVGVKNIINAVDCLLENAGLSIQSIHSIGLATPGTMDIPAGMLLDPPNLPGWTNLPIRDQIANHYNKRTILQNDANAAAYGEFWAGAGRSSRSMIFWTLGTGVGCGIIVGDTIIQGQHSHGSECGHIIIEMDNGRLCSSGQYGTLEAYASATALMQRCKEQLPDVTTSLSHRLDAGETLTPILIAEEATAGDQFCDDLIMETARYLGVGTTSVMHTIDPDLVLIGGAMTFGRNETELGRRFLKRVRDEVKLRAFPVPYENTVIDFASLGSNAGYIGAAGCARQAFYKKPTD